jgi:hypothetical protein
MEVGSSVKTVYLGRRSARCTVRGREWLLVAYRPRRSVMAQVPVCVTFTQSAAGRTSDAYPQGRETPQHGTGPQFRPAPLAL